jgi:hypothetical protein
MFDDTRLRAIEQCARQYAAKHQPYTGLDGRIVGYNWPVVRREAFINDVLTLCNVENPYAAPVKTDG